MISVRQLRSAAEMRRESASLLADHGREFDGVYLLGYAAECALKCLILNRTPRSQMIPLIEGPLFRGSLGHSLDALQTHLIRKCGENWPQPIRRAIRLINDKWSVDMRYESKRITYVCFVDILNAVDELLEWADGRISDGN